MVATPAKPGPIEGPRPHRRRDAKLLDAPDRGNAVLVGIHRLPPRSGVTRDFDGRLMQIIGAGDTHIKGTEIARIPVIAGLVIDTLVLLPALVEDAAVIEPIDQGLGATRDRIEGVGDRFRYHVLEGGT